MMDCDCFFLQQLMFACHQGQYGSIKQWRNGELVATWANEETYSYDTPITHEYVSRLLFIYYYYLLLLFITVLLFIIIIYFIMIVLHAHYSTHFTQFLLPTASFLGDKINGIWIYQYASAKREKSPNLWLHEAQQRLCSTRRSVMLNTICVPRAFHAKVPIYILTGPGEKCAGAISLRIAYYDTDDNFA